MFITLRRASLLAMIAAACSTPPNTSSAPAGDPLPGLTGIDLARFQTGLALFDKVYTPDEGLGPFFNENQCSACHTDPASGGTTGFERIVKATRHDEQTGKCDLLVEGGGENVRSQATPVLRAKGIEGQEIPAEATETGRFTPTPLFGLGLVEAIPTESILEREDPGDANGDGISGRAGRTDDGKLARFGRKAEFVTIRDFAEHALRQEMGLTTHVVPHEGTVAARVAAMHDVDPVMEPEIDSTTLDLLATFVRLLAAPEPAAPRSSAHADTLRSGRRLFERVGCTSCHTPAMRTAASDDPAMARRTVELYSDLLLHDMGAELASTCGVSASPTELRTAMLMGLRHRTFLLHDGRTSDLREAILAHGGEAQRARDAFARLRWIEQEFVVLFLRSL